jgi:hypothetical protein
MSKFRGVPRRGEASCCPSQTPFSIVPPLTHRFCSLADQSGIVVQTNPLSSVPHIVLQKSKSQRHRQRSHHDNPDNSGISDLYSIEPDKSRGIHSLNPSFHRVIEIMPSREGRKSSLAAQRQKCRISPAEKKPRARYIVLSPGIDVKVRGEVQRLVVLLVLVGSIILEQSRRARLLNLAHLGAVQKPPAFPSLDAAALRCRLVVFWLWRGRLSLDGSWRGLPLEHGMPV